MQRRLNGCTSRIRQASKGVGSCPCGGPSQSRFPVFWQSSRSLCLRPGPSRSTAAAMAAEAVTQAASVVAAADSVTQADSAAASRAVATAAAFLVLSLAPLLRACLHSLHAATVTAMLLGRERPLTALPIGPAIRVSALRTTLPVGASRAPATTIVIEAAIARSIAATATATRTSAIPGEFL